MTRKREAGQALIFAAIAMVVLLGFAGLGIDMGVLRYQKRLQQSAADAAAIAGASNLAVGSGVTLGAQNAAAANGFTDGSGNGGCPDAVGCVVVTVNNPPTTGPHASGVSAINYVEVLVTAVHPTYFMKVLGINRETITARAVATNLSGGGAGSGCLYTLGAPSSSIEGIYINGSATLNAVNCGIVDNGNFNTKGNKLIVKAATFGMAGGDIGTGGGTVTCTQTPTSCPTPNMPAAGDPLSYLTPPCSPCAVSANSIKISGNGNFSGTGVSYSNGVYTVQPGSYSSITITGTAGSNVVFSPGTYIIDGGTTSGLNIPANATITGDGVTFYFTNSSTVTVVGTPSINLTAPSSGTYSGILMYQDPTDTNVGPSPNGPTLGGNSGSNYTGVLYFPSDQLTFYGNNTSFDVGIVVSDSLALKGNPTVNLQGTAGLPPGAVVIQNAILVE